MQLPDGRECPYYYQHLQRWHTGKAECRLLAGAPDARRWTDALCRTCPVPDIRRANACPTLTLHARIARPSLRFWEKPHMRIEAACTRSGGPVKDPYVGCGLCHSGLTFVVAEEES